MKKLLLLVFSTVAFCVAQAQVTTSSIHGKVVDDNRKPVVGATVIAVHTPTGTEYAVATSRDGMFNLGGMRVGGPYDITVSFVGCNDEKYSNVYLTIGEDAQFNTTLHESSTDIGEVVVMGTANPVFNSNRTGAQEIISRDMMDKLPTVNRSLTDYTRLTPMSSGSNFAGTSYRFNNVTVDGASFNNSFGLSASLGASGIEPISLESIEQVQVMIAPFDVRNGGFTGGGINSVTKSGSNEWEASAYFYKKSPSMTGYRVKDYIGTVKEFTSNQYGLSLSGPIIKNKLFFFLNGELDRIEEPI
ncbi:MAG: carboxypeptidase regulatory-like domain-containing protein, partial [Alistipes sp.]|nr:carboxypeptidase regulatory-like domain-containing protein [Alistipes sp.]